jgi:hypothetical protein
MPDRKGASTGPDITERLEHMRENADVGEYGEEVLYRAKQEIERLRRKVERVEAAIEGQWEYNDQAADKAEKCVTVHRLRVALDG